MYAPLCNSLNFRPRRNPADGVSRRRGRDAPAHRRSAFHARLVSGLSWCVVVVGTLFARCPLTRAGSTSQPTLIEQKQQQEPGMSTGNGKICYLEIPAVDIQASSKSYQSVFGWKLRTRGDGVIAFDDGVGQVSGTWVLDRNAMTEVGLLVYIMVDSVADYVERVVANGGTIVQPIGADAPVVTARFTDPAGNVLGLYQD